MDELVVAYSKNLSRGGVFIRTKKFLPVDSVVRLHLELPDGGGELIVRCRVAFIRDETDWGDVGKPTGMGIQFLDQSDDVRVRIEQFISGCAGPDHEPDSAPEQSLRVLVVDDDKAYCDVAAEPFRLRGDTVFLAHDGIEALAVCIKEHPDIILSDVTMPRMDGWQFLRMVRARPQFASVPFLFLTTLTSETDRLKGYRLGVDDYIAKPYRPKEVQARADQAVRRARLRKDQAAETTSLRGDLLQVSLTSVMSFLEMERKTGLLLIEAADLQASISLADGAPRQLKIDGAAPPAKEQIRVLHRALDLAQGRFEFIGSDTRGDDDLQTTVTAVLLSHARASDEGHAK